MRAYLILFLLLFCVCNFSWAQREITEESKGLKERGYLGFGIGGLNFGTDSFYGRYFSVGGSVLAGYMVTTKMSMGLGFDYTYFTYSDQDYKRHMYVVFPFVRYNIQQFFIQLDYDYYTIKENTELLSNLKLERLFLGAGYHAGMTNILIQYDLFYSSSSPFSSPLNIRVFFTFPR